MSSQSMSRTIVPWIKIVSRVSYILFAIECGHFCKRHRILTGSFCCEGHIGKTALAACRPREIAILGGHTWSRVRKLCCSTTGTMAAVPIMSQRWDATAGGAVRSSEHRRFTGASRIVFDPKLSRSRRTRWQRRTASVPTEHWWSRLAVGKGRCGWGRRPTHSTMKANIPPLIHSSFDWVLVRRTHRLRRCNEVSLWYTDLVVGDNVELSTGQKLWWWRHGRKGRWWRGVGWWVCWTGQRWKLARVPTGREAEQVGQICKCRRVRWKIKDRMKIGRVLWARCIYQTTDLLLVYIRSIRISGIGQNKLLVQTILRSQIRCPVEIAVVHSANHFQLSQKCFDSLFFGGYGHIVVNW